MPRRSGPNADAPIRDGLAPPASSRRPGNTTKNPQNDPQEFPQKFSLSAPNS
jgi:hypothetical protein